MWSFLSDAPLMMAFGLIGALPPMLYVHYRSRRVNRMTKRLIASNEALEKQVEEARAAHEQMNETMGRVMEALIGGLRLQPGGWRVAVDTVSDDEYRLHVRRTIGEPLFQGPPPPSPPRMH